MKNPYDRQILHLAIPSIITNITVPLLGLVDVAIVGHLGGVEPICAVAVGSMVFNVLYWAFAFLRMGTSGLAAQALGRGAMAASGRVLAFSLSLALGAALLILLLQWPLREAALWLMGSTGAMRDLIVTYFNICVWGAPAVLGAYALTGWFIGMQDTRLPMWMAVFQNLLNIAVSTVLVFACGMGIEGVALGTLVAAWGGFAFGIALCFSRFFSHLALLSPRQFVNLSTRQLVNLPARQLAIYRDIFLRTLFLIAVNLAFTVVGAREGDVTLAVNTLLMTLFTLFSYVMDGFAYAAEALCGRSYGSGDREEFRHVCRRLWHWGLATALLVTLVYLVGGRPFLSLLTDDGVVLAAAEPYRGWSVLIPIAGVGAFIFDGIFIGMTDTRGMLAATSTSAAAFFLAWILLRDAWGNHALWFSFLLFLLLRGIVQYVWLRRGGGPIHLSTPSENAQKSKKL